MTQEQLALRAEIMQAFAATGAAPPVSPSPELDALVQAHVVVLGGDGAI